MNHPPRREDVVDFAVAHAVSGALPSDPTDLEPSERAAIERQARRLGVTFDAAHALRRSAARDALARLSARREIRALALRAREAADGQ
ncbi:hypothetical protein [Agromyces sp. SYSU T00266]|uniref:hypothetical protein n=1 Tax=Agromyces zhanjiangensis TaxID=3158562 RepID=UPI003392CD5F